MNAATSRRRFVANTAALAAAALILPSSRTFGRTMATAPAGPDATQRDNHEAVRGLVERYGHITDLASSGDSVRLAVRVGNISAMQMALADARPHGIKRVWVADDVVSFTSGQSKYEIRHIIDES